MEHTPGWRAVPFCLLPASTWHQHHVWRHAMQVHRARDRQSGAVVALKVSYLQQEGELPRHVRRELRVLRALAGQPAIVQLLDMRQQVRGRAHFGARQGTAAGVGKG